MTVFMASTGQGRRFVLRNSALKKFNLSTVAPASGRLPTPSLQEVPILPYLGSTLPKYSNVPPFDPTTMLGYWPALRERYGDFFKIGLPGFGVGRDGILYVINDPQEMMKVLHQEKANRVPYPVGIVQSEWPLIKYLKEVDSLLITAKGNDQDDEDGFFGRGSSWKHMRAFLQTDLLSPKSAKRYIAGMSQAAKIASSAAPASKDNMNEYFNRCAFDMFNSLMLGEMTKTADLTLASEENKDFCNNTVGAMREMVGQMISPYENIVGFQMGLKTAKYKEMCKLWDSVLASADAKCRHFWDNYNNDYDSLSDLQKDSYFAHAIRRQKESNGEFSEEDLLEVSKVMLSATVDTTSSPMSWSLYHVAANQNVQAKLYDELAAALKEHGEINEAFLHPKTTPYLHAIIRESHRITPATPTAMSKDNPVEDVEIHGTIIPKGSKFLFDSFSIGMDPSIVENPTSFQPERWLEDAIQSRKGTPAEVLDHPFFKTPFSHGSRKCPGSRVAQYEILVLLSQIILDWKVTVPSNIKGFEDMKYEMSGMIVPKLPSFDFESRSG